MTTEVTAEAAIAFNNNNSYTSVITTNVNDRFFVEDQDRIAANRQALRAANLPPVHPSLYTSFSEPENDPHEETADAIIRHVFEAEILLSDEKKGTSKDDYLMVFIWDIEEVTQLSWNYVAEFTQCYPHVNAACLYELVERVLMSVNFSSSYELKEGNIVNIDDEVDVESEFIKRVAPKYNALRKLYNEIRVLKDCARGKWTSYPIPELIERSGMIERTVELRHASEHLHSLCKSRWNIIVRCMDLINRGSEKTNHKFGNIVLCGDGIGYGAGQLLVSGNAAMIPVENIYSTAKSSTESVLEKIRSRFGEKCTLVSITSCSHTSAAAEKLKIPVWFVETNYAFVSLYSYLTARFIQNFEPYFAKCRPTPPSQRSQGQQSTEEKSIIVREAN